MRVVFDAGVVLAGAGWRQEPHLCLVLAAKCIAILTPRAFLSRVAAMFWPAGDQRSKMR